MAWYVWLAILVGVVVIGWIKLKVLKSFMAKRAEKNQPMEDDE